LTVIVAVLPTTVAVIPVPTKSNIVAFPFEIVSSLTSIALNVPAPAEVTAPQLQFPEPSAIGT
jgi:hypothetical protein